MTATIPTTEPAVLTAGVTWSWKRTLADYPAPTWTLTYHLVGASYKSSFAASADGSDHLVDVVPTTTDDYAAGHYQWIAVVTDGTDKHVIGRGSFEIKPDPAQLEVHDGRSHARKVLAALEAAIEKRASKSQTSMSIDGVTISHMSHAELIAAREKYQAEVVREERAERIARGQRAGGKILTRF